MTITNVEGRGPNDKVITSDIQGFKSCGQSFATKITKCSNWINICLTRVIHGMCDVKESYVMTDVAIEFTHVIAAVFGNQLPLTH